MFNITGGIKRQKIIAVADIESGSAGVAIVGIRAGEPARVLVAERSTLPFEERPPKHTATRVMAQLHEAGEKALAAYRALGRKGPVSEAYAIIRAPWTRSKTIRMVSQLKSEERVTDKIIATLAQEAVGKDTEFDRVNILETTIVRVQLNGYPTSTPVGKRAREIAVSILQSNCDPKIRSQITETLTKIFSCGTVRLRSGTRSLITVLRENTELPRDCLVVDMGSDASSVFVVRHGSIAEHIVVSEGTRSILKRIGGDTLPEETLTLMRLLAHDACEDAACAKIIASLARTEPDLVRIFGEAMAKLVGVERLPNAMILFAPEDFAPWLAQLFSRIDFTQFTVTTQPFLPTKLSRENLAAFVTDEPGIIPDLGLSLGSALVNIEEQAA